MKMSTTNAYNPITSVGYTNFSFSNNQLLLTPISVNNLTQSIDEQDEMFFDYFVLVLYFFTSVIAILGKKKENNLFLIIQFYCLTSPQGNLFVCYVISKFPKFKSTTFTLLFNMAVSDLISGLVITLQWFFCSQFFIQNYSPRLCVINKSLQILSYYISTYSMMFIAVDRFMLIKYPHNKGLPMNKYFCVSLTWCVGILFSMTTLINMRINVYFGKNLISCLIAYPVKGQLAFVLRKYRIAVLIVSYLEFILLDSIKLKRIFFNFYA